MSLRSLLDRFRRPTPTLAWEEVPATSRAHPVGTVVVNVFPDTTRLRAPLPRRPPATPHTRATLHLEVALTQIRAALADIDRWADTPDAAEARVRRVAACHQIDAVRARMADAHRALLHQQTEEEP